MATGDRDDELVTAALCALEDYLDDQQQAMELLKQGFLKLTMARMSLPSNVLGEISYKDQFEAALSVKQESDGTLIVVRTAELLESSESDEESASTLKRRGGDTRTSDKPSSASASSGNNAVEDEAIMWFSSLPPQHLRLAQKHFRRGTLGSSLRATMTTHATMEGNSISAQLSARYFRPGGVVRGVMQLYTTRDTADATTEIAYVVAQIHGHVSVDSNLLTVPVVPLASPRSASRHERENLEDSGSRSTFWDSKNGSLPDVNSFSGETGSCIFLSPPCALLSDVNIAPTPSELAAPHGREETMRRCRRDFAIALPSTICPTFRGTSARVFYVLSITAQGVAADSKPVSIHLPLDVYASEFYFGPTTLAAADEPHAEEDDTPTEGGLDAMRRARSVSVSAVPVGVRNGSEVPFEVRPSLMHGRVETERLQRTQTSIYTIGKDDAHLVRFLLTKQFYHPGDTSIYTIGKDDAHLVRFLLTKQFYHPGDVLLGVFDFSNGKIPCHAISASLCVDETLAAMSLQPGKVVQSKVIASSHELTSLAVHTNIRFCIPHDAIPSIQTDLVCFEWLLRFEFTTSVTAATSTGDEAAGAATRQTFRWQVPIDVRPAPVREETGFANVPHKLFTGSSRHVSL
ncbi:hypothetical protein P43SY_000109 [Pythium insidiosum]|uniref:Uncharacterized protein n=1 Tax=Pythium insidiosum TaxID=114742 RepID=A0AAD5M2I8_PYTIN|nr:hypothetical protein P43SY_000109 [Pythium insidiosum]